MITVKELKLKKQYSFMYENFVLSSQQTLFLLLEETNDKISALKFNFSIYKYGYPNDEVNHPLSNFGLGFYGLFEVHNSPWIEELKMNNRSHPSHNDNMDAIKKHFIAKFKDVTLEVICNQMEEIELSKAELVVLINEQIGYLKT